MTAGAVLLDIDGTLVDSNYPLLRALPGARELVREVGRRGAHKAGVQAARAVYVGDTVWDVQAAGAAGVACVGVLTGGICAAQLRDAGAVATYDDAAHLLRELDDSPLAAVLQ